MWCDVKVCGATIYETKLQLALDFADLHRAIDIAKEAVKGGVDWLEAGTPLIKSEGLNAVRVLKRKFPSYTIVADMKTIDTGSYEVEIAAKSGADIVIILAAANDCTVKEALEAGKKYGAKIMVDLIGVSEPVSRSVELEKLGVDYICVHVGIDQQMKGLNPLTVLKEVRETVRVPIAIAGGINSETAADAVEAGVEIIIVGGAITKAANTEEAVRAIKKAMKTRKPVTTELYRKCGEDELSKVFSEVSTANISDAMHRKGEMFGIIAVTKLKVVGRAFTVLASPGDWAKPVEAIDSAKPGDILVIDAMGSQKAVWGELATASCLVKGLAGAVVDGAVRDVASIVKMNFPVFSRYVNPTAGEPKGFGEINVEVTCGGVKVRPRDWIVGDFDGVVVIPKEEAVEIANRAKDIFEREQRIKAEINMGSTLSKVLKIKKWEKLFG